MGKRGFQPHPCLASAATLRALMKRHRWIVAGAAQEIGRTKSTVYHALKTYGVSIPKRQAQEIRTASARHAANERWKR